MGDFDAAVGSALRSLRAGKGMTILDLVDRTGIPGPDIEAFEAGAPIPNATLHALSSAFDMSLPSFLRRARPPSLDAAASVPTGEEGFELVQNFVKIASARSRRFLIDMALALREREADVTL